MTTYSPDLQYTEVVGNLVIYNATEKAVKMYNKNCILIRRKANVQNQQQADQVVDYFKMVLEFKNYNLN